MVKKGQFFWVVCLSSHFYSMQSHLLSPAVAKGTWEYLTYLW